MAEKKLTVYEALQEKKLLEKRIAGIDFKNTLFVTYSGKNDTDVSGVPMDKAVAAMKANYTSILHLISNLAAYSAAITQSNAVTKVTMNGKEYTVAEAIARYNNIAVEKKFLQTLANQFVSTKNFVEKHNTDIKDPKKVSEYIQNVLGEKRTDATISSATDTYYENNLWTILDPNELNNSINDKIEELNSFAERFHFILTQSNAVTEITVNLED